MQTHWRINHRKELLLFFTGWGMDEHPCEMLKSERFDLCTCHDYQSLSATELKIGDEYSSVTVVAWSMGIWAAEQILKNTALPVIRKVAINGSPVPVHDQFGIPEKMALATYHTLTPETLKRFYRRMFGGEILLRQMESYLPVINFEEQKKELKTILDYPALEPSLCWDKVILSTEDSIFPIQNLRAFWSGRASCQEIRAPHYPFHLYPNWEVLVNE